MIEINGKHNKALVYCNEIEEDAYKQIKNVCDLYIFRNQHIRIMPDCHSGKGCVIGFTAGLPDEIVPSLIGVDIGCGMMVVRLGTLPIDFSVLDDFIKNKIPSGFDINRVYTKQIDDEIEAEIRRLSELTHTDFTKHLLSLGTLGGGNHFIEININEKFEKYLVIHTGSRNFGLQIANYYQKKAQHHCEKIKKKFKAEKEFELKRIRKQKNKMLENKIEEEFETKMLPYHVSGNLSFLEDLDRDHYLKDMKFAQKFASLNRYLIADQICEHLKVDLATVEHFETVHNYINFDDKIIRKGAVSAHRGEKLIIPINMRDGSIIALGKGNIDYNHSAPHGAGRLLSRKNALMKLSMDEFVSSMDGIYTSSVNEKTLDESPMAYKPIEMILEFIEETVEVLEIIKPLYNYKAE